MFGPFVRKNALTVSATFTPTGDDDLLAPGSATLVLNYTDLSGVTHDTSIDMTNDDGIWSATWDSSASGEGPVYWLVYSEGQIIAAAQGQIYIQANSANTI